MITSNKRNLVREGYLDVKVPPGNPERKLWKAWQRRWLVSNRVEEPFGLQLQIYGCQKASNGQCQKASNGQSLWTVFISPESGKLYRSRSRTHPWAFSIASGATIVLHLACESEQLSQSWMASIRDALWLPSPLVQLEAAFQDVHRVSIVDDENTCRSDLFGAYGHLYMAGDVILLMSTHSGRLIKQWHLWEILNVQLERSDEGKASGVFSLAFQKASSQHGEKLSFYSQTASSVVQNISMALKMRQAGKELSSTPKYDSGIQELSEFLNLESETYDSTNSGESEGWPSKGLTEGLKNLATFSGDFLNCSVNSVFTKKAFSSGSRSSSDASSDYSPPVSPTDPTPPKQDNATVATRRNSKDALEYYYDADINLRRNSLEGVDSHYALMAPRQSSSASYIYADISSLPPSRRPSLAETLYEDIEEDEEGFVKLMDEIMEDENMPPLPPPRNAHNANIPDQCTGRPVSAAKRPSTLGLENLSSSISETLSQMRELSPSEPNCKVTKKSFPVGLFKPIRGVKRILSNKKNVKSPLITPTKENCPNSILENNSSPTETSGITNSDGCQSSEALLIMNFVDSSEPEHEGNPDFETNSSGFDSSSAHVSDEQFVPFPELLPPSPVGCTNEPHLDRNEMKQQKNNPHLTQTSSAVLRERRGSKQTRSCGSLLVESLKSKYSCHRHFLEFLQAEKNEDDKHNTMRHACQQKCFPRSVSLEQLPCKSLHCCCHSTDNDTFFSRWFKNIRNDDSTTATDLKIRTLEATVFQHVLSRRRSSDYCVMNPLISHDNGKECELYVPMNNQKIKEAKVRTESVSQGWSSSLPMQMNDRESLYMDMNQTTQ